ncbi:hypothetical protein [Bacillus sp. AK031]
MKKVEAYFKNENDAEGVRTKLRTLNVEDGMIEKVPNGRNLTDIVSDLFGGEEHRRGDNPYVYKFTVSEEDHDKARTIVQDHYGYIR